MRQRMGHGMLSLLLVLCMVLSPVLSTLPCVESKAADSETVRIFARDYGAVPDDDADDEIAFQEAFEAAKELEETGVGVTLVLEEGSYDLYKDYALTKEYYPSNTNSTTSDEKKVALVIEGHENLTVEGNNALFLVHGNMMVLAVVDSVNVVLQDFDWDFAVPTVSEMTILEMGTTDTSRPYTDFFIPDCCPYQITGSTISWYSEKSPYDGNYYWTNTGIHDNSYSVVVRRPADEMTRSYYTSDSPFSGVSYIEREDSGYTYRDSEGSVMTGSVVRIVYTRSRPSVETESGIGATFEFCSSAYRETCGAFVWESENVTMQNVDVHYMHGFGFLVQMSRDVFFYGCDFMPRDGSGHYTVSYADGIHVAGAAGSVVIEDCNFSNTHDDPINIHGSFTRVESIDPETNTLTLKYIHTQQGGFPQFHVGDEVLFYTRDTLESSDGETVYTVAEVISNPGEDGNDRKTQVVRFEEELPSYLSDRISGEPKYVAENITYSSDVTIRGCTFKYVPTRGILCTTRGKVTIEDNIFYNMSMATIYLSNDSDEWYESGPIRDMTIRGNTFYVKDIGRTSWTYAPAIYVHPVTKGGGLPSSDNPIHKNITIEENTFYMDEDVVLLAESVENLTFRNNTICRYDPDIELSLEAQADTMLVGDWCTLTTTATGSTNDGTYDDVFQFTACKDVLVEDNRYDDGLKLDAILSSMPQSNLTMGDEEILVNPTGTVKAGAAVSGIRYESSDPSVLTVNENGRVLAKKAGKATVTAVYEWIGGETYSDSVEITVVDESQVSTTTVTILEEDNRMLTEKGASLSYTAQTSDGSAVTWSVEDFQTGAATDAASIDRDGVLTAEANGIVWVVARSGYGVDRRVAVISLADDETLNSSFAIRREDENYYTVSEDAVSITLIKGDLYQSDNNVSNLFLYTIPEEVDRDNLRTVIRVDGLPVRESNQWDTASFILYADDDNYITVGKKSHYTGISTVEERNASAVETSRTSSEDDSLTSAYFGFYKNGDTVLVSYKKDGGSWTDIATIQADMLGSDFRIGFTAWATNERGKMATFSEFRVGSGDLSYEELLAQPAVSFLEPDNDAPHASHVSFDAARYTVGDTASVTFDYSDPNGDAQGATLYCFAYENGLCEVTQSPSLVLEYAGTLTCTVYPVDERGMPGTPSEAVTVSVDRVGADDPVYDGLLRMIQAAEEKDVSDCTPQSRKILEEALEEARAVLADETADEDDYFDATNALIYAMAGLVYDVQKIHLEVALDIADEILLRSDLYEEDELQELAAAVEAGQAVVDRSDATQEETDRAATAILEALQRLTIRDDSMLSGLIETAQQLLDGDFTSDSLANLQAAIDAAMTAVESGDSDAIDRAYADLIDAIIGMQRIANKAALYAMLREADEILSNADTFVASTIDGLDALTEAALAVYEDETASQEEVNAMIEELTVAAARARLLGDVDGDGVISTSDSTVLLQYAAEQKELSPEALESADVNRDGVADTSDAVRILQYAAEKIDKF